MKKTFHFVIRLSLLVLFVVPLMANDSCSSALKKAEENQDETTPEGSASPDATTSAGFGDKGLPVLPEGSEGKAIQEGGGPEVISEPAPPVE